MLKYLHTHARQLFVMLSYTLLAFFVTLVGMLSFIQFSNTSPSFAELSFTGHSPLGKNAGSVMPASCNSNPPTSHFAGDCPTDVRVAVSGDKRVKLTVWSNRADGTIWDVMGTLYWSVTGADSCVGSWGGAVAMPSGSIGHVSIPVDVWGYDKPFGISIYCSNSSGMFSRHGVWFVTPPDPCSGGCGA